MLAEIKRMPLIVLNHELFCSPRGLMHVLFQINPISKRAATRRVEWTGGRCRRSLRRMARPRCVHLETCSNQYSPARVLATTQRNTRKAHLRQPPETLCAASNRGADTHLQFASNE